jgi:hypothetical protein
MLHRVRRVDIGLMTQGVRLVQGFGKRLGRGRRGGGSCDASVLKGSLVSSINSTLGTDFFGGGGPVGAGGKPLPPTFSKGAGAPFCFYQSPFAACKADLRLTTPHVDELPRIARPRHTVGARALPFEDRVAFEPLPSSSPFVRAT